MEISDREEDVISYFLKTMKWAFAALFLIPIFGTWGYYHLGHGQWPIFECLYMTIITVTTVGFSEVIPIEGNVPARAFTMGLLLVSNVSLAIVFTKLASVFLAGELGLFREKLRMKKRIEELRDHTIVCGSGPIAHQIVEELHQARRRYVVVSTRLEDMERLKTIDPDILYHVSTVVDEEELILTGVKHASGLVTALDDERDNLFLTVTAKELNKKVRIVSMCDNVETTKKLKLVGADAVVNPKFIGGVRMASELLRPTVVTFLDHLLRDSRKGLRFEELKVSARSPYLNHHLRELHVWEQTGLTIVAVAEEDGDIVYNPPPDMRLRKGMRVILIGNQYDLQKLGTFLNGEHDVVTS